MNSFSILKLLPILAVVVTSIASMTFHRDEQPVVNLGSPTIFYPGEEIRLNVEAYSDLPTDLPLLIYRVVDPIGFFAAQKDRHDPGVEVSPNGDSVAGFSLRDPSLFHRLHVGTKLAIPKNMMEWKEVKLPAMTSGVYLITAPTARPVSTTLVIVSRLGVVVKQSPTDALAFVVDRRTGERVEGAAVHFMSSKRGEKGAETKTLRAVTGSDGVAHVSFSDENGEVSHRRQDTAVIYGMRGNDFVIADCAFPHFMSGGNRVYLHTDRSVYRPSQRVHYRGILREMSRNGVPGLPSTDSVDVTVTDSRGSTVWNERLPLSDLGTFQGEFLLGEEPPLGSYTMTTSYDMGPGATFQVEEYKKPEYEVTVRPDRKEYSRGDTLKAVISASYYFGAPVAGGNLRYTVRRNRLEPDAVLNGAWAHLREAEEPAADPGQIVSEGSGTLSSDGSFDMEYLPPADDADYTYTITAAVVDASRRSIAGTASVRFTRASIYLLHRPEKYIYRVGEKVKVDVETYSHSGDKRIPLPYRILVRRILWEQEGRGARRETTILEGRGARRETTILTDSATTGADGSGSISFTTDGPGYLEIEIAARDERGNIVKAASQITVADGTPAQESVTPGLARLMPDREIYRPGDIVTALVVLPAGGKDLLLTAEGRAIGKYRVEKLGGRSAIVRMEVGEADAPNINLVATTFAGDQVYSATASVIVAPADKEITLEVETDRKEYRPGDSGMVTVRALDKGREPMKNVDLALSIVDEAIFAIRPDRTPAITSFFYRFRPVTVTTSHSAAFRFAPRYSPVRYRVATITSTGDGVFLESATLASAFIDNSVTSFDIGQDAGREPGIDMPTVVEPTLRKDFRDLMFWAPSVRTGSDGRARIPVKFPDNLTTWRITARGVNAETAVGEARAQVVSRKDLLVRMEIPRFVIEGDSLLVATTVHNYLSTEKRVRVELLTEGLSVSQTEQTILLPADGEGRIDWPVTVGKQGAALLTVRALTDEESDAAALTLPVLPFGIRREAAAVGRVSREQSRDELILTIPEGVDPASAGLTVSLTSSTAGAMVGALDYLIGYSYGCAEQTMSRFLPTVIVANVLKEADIPFDEVKRKELPKMVRQGLDRLYSFQHGDGGWGWWEHDGTNPFMTAYIMYGLTIARRAGYPISEERYDNGLRSLRRQIEDRPAGGNYGSADASLRSSTEAFMLYTASMIDGQRKKDRLIEERITELAAIPEINSYTRALLAMAATHRSRNDVAATLRHELRTRVEGSGDETFWSGNTWEHGWQDDKIETSAWAVRALCTEPGSDSTAARGVQWLMSQRTGGAWPNTRQSAMAIFALVDHLKAVSETNPEFAVRISVNGRPAGEERFGRENSGKTITIDPSLLRPGRNIVTIEKSGTGTANASARLSYIVTGSAVEPSNNGFEVTREYYLLRREQTDEGFVYVKEPFDGTVKSGDEIFVRVSFVPTEANEYIMLEDPLPAGCEVVENPELYPIEDEEGYGPSAARTDARGATWNWWYAGRDVRDEKIAFFASSVEPRSYECTYILRAQIPGVYSVMPSTACLMYYPEIEGTTAIQTLTILE